MRCSSWKYWLEYHFQGDIQPMDDFIDDFTLMDDYMLENNLYENIIAVHQ